MIMGRRGQRRSAEYAWLITGPLAIFAIASTVGFWIAEPDWYEHWLGGLAALIGICLTYVGVFNVVIRRSTYSVILTEVPFVLALFYLPPPLPTLAVVVATI